MPAIPKDPKDNEVDTTPPKKKPRDEEAKIKVISFSNGINLIAYLEDPVDLDISVLNLRAPVVLTTIEDSDTSEITGFFTSPFMSPYIDFDISKVIQVSAVDLFCVEAPNEFLLQKFREIINNLAMQENVSVAVNAKNNIIEPENVELFYAPDDPDFA